MTKPTHNPKGRPQVRPEVGKPVEQIIEDKPEATKLICGACSAAMPEKYPNCPYCAVPLRWE